MSWADIIAVGMILMVVVGCWLIRPLPEPDGYSDEDYYSEKDE